jgi:dihydrofolate synthase/folylpolyglutamate synthase
VLCLSGIKYTNRFATVGAPSALLKETTLLGRFSSFEREGVKIILDVAHNPASSQLLFEKLSSKRFNRVIAVWASLADKALADIIDPMKNIVNSWCIGPIVEGERSVTTDVLHRALIAKSISQLFTFPSILKAFEGAFELAKQEEGAAIVVFGSFHTVAPILAFLREERA